jgi:hypothetical protein
VTIPLEEIVDIKAYDYAEKKKNMFGIMVIRSCLETQNEPTLFEQVLLLFDGIDERDTWHDGLKSLLSSKHWPEAEPASKAKLRLIKKVVEVTPEENQVISCEITLAESALGKEEALMFSVPKAAYEKERKEIRQRGKEGIEARAQEKKKYRSDLCKELVQDFVLQNFVIPAEGVSLYRYIRSLINRLSMEQETIAITKEIDNLRWNPAEHVQMVMLQKRHKLDDDEKKLTDLRNSLRDRIGTHGPAASLVIRVLERSIDKTKSFNEYHRHAVIGTGEAGDGTDDVTGTD